MPLANQQLTTGNGFNVPVLPASLENKQFYTLSASIEPCLFDKVKLWVKKLDATLNDAFMAAYAQVICEMIGADEIQLPCPVDLRQSVPNLSSLTIANMTGTFHCPIQHIPGQSIHDTTIFVDTTMRQLKERNAGFDAIPQLLLFDKVMPKALLQMILKHSFFIEPTSFTNLGKIDDTLLCLDGTSINRCYLCGTYRQAPSFQLSVSTYKNTCTLASNLYATDVQANSGQLILDKVKSRLLGGVG